MRKNYYKKLFNEDYYFDRIWELLRLDEASLAEQDSQIRDVLLDDDRFAALKTALESEGEELQEAFYKFIVGQEQGGLSAIFLSKKAAVWHKFVELAQDDGFNKTTSNLFPRILKNIHEFNGIDGRHLKPLMAADAVAKKLRNINSIIQKTDVNLTQTYMRKKKAEQELKVLQKKLDSQKKQKETLELKFNTAQKQTSDLELQLSKMRKETIALNAEASNFKKRLATFEKLAAEKQATLEALKAKRTALKRKKAPVRRKVEAKFTEAQKHLQAVVQKIVKKNDKSALEALVKKYETLDDDLYLSIFTTPKAITLYENTERILENLNKASRGGFRKGEADSVKRQCMKAVFESGFFKSFYIHYRGDRTASLVKSYIETADETEAYATLNTIHKSFYEAYRATTFEVIEKMTNADHIETLLKRTKDNIFTYGFATEVDHDTRKTKVKKDSEAYPLDPYVNRMVALIDRAFGADPSRALKNYELMQSAFKQKEAYINRRYPGESARTVRDRINSSEKRKTWERRVNESVEAARLKIYMVDTPHLGMA
jgi:regulator of replication initiation timing